MSKPNLSGNLSRELNPGPLAIFDYLKDNGPKTKQDLIEATSFSERSVRNYISYLMDKTLIKELPNYGRTKIYATIDYVPVMDETKPLLQRWEVFSKASQRRFSVGELATYFGNGIESQSETAASYLFKVPALLVYFAQEHELSDEAWQEQMDHLKEVLKDACDQLESAIGVFNQFITDPRYWRRDLLAMFAASPDYVLSKDLPAIINRLSEGSDENS